MRAGRVLAAHALVDAFGHVSARLPQQGQVLITPPVPLGTLGDDSPLLELRLDTTTLPDGVPKEAWIHWAILRSRPDVSAVCRAQPPHVVAAAGAGVRIRALHGQGAFLGAVVPVHDDARLVRDRRTGEAVARALALSPAVVLRGNGAVTVGHSVGEAVARMYVLEASARINLGAAAAGGRHELSLPEVSA